GGAHARSGRDGGGAGAAVRHPAHLQGAARGGAGRARGGAARRGGRGAAPGRGGEWEARDRDL
ncbi:MAG: hypothetical protein AVDCRST_MAG40-1454, partial [uncultured Gemmatimonadaceae bacterium]